jgi:hypothetical protein
LGRFDPGGGNGRPEWARGFAFRPHHRKTRVIEHFTLEDNNKTLVDTLTFTDPDVFREPYSLSWRFDRMADSAERMEAVCEPDLDALAAADLNKVKDVDVEAARMLDPANRYNASGNAVDIKKK